MTDENNIVGAPVKDASTLHQRADALGIIGLLLALLCTVCAYYTWQVAAAALDFLGINNAIYFSVAMIAIALVSILFVPAIRGFTLSRNAVASLARGDVVQARIDTAAAREKSLITIGWSVFVKLPNANGRTA